jgi:hypothetical protein
MTLYVILGVPRNATQEEIRTAYRSLARRYHPDGQNGNHEADRDAAEENIKAINAAYRTLGDPKRRQDYHLVMWTRHDPARQYRFRRPPGGSPFPDQNGNHSNGSDKTRPSSNEAKALYLEILKVKAEKDNLTDRHATRRRRLWMSAGFTSLIVYFLMAFGTQIYASYQELLSITLYFLGVELITMSIILNSSGMRFVNFPFVGNPIGFAVTVTLGTIVTCSSIPNIEMGLSTPSGLYSGSIISTALLIHLFLGTRLARIQDVEFEAQLKELQTQLAELEARFQNLNRKG